MLEQDPAIVNDEYVFLDESLGARFGFLDGQPFGISCAAEFLHRADAAFRFIRQANNGTKIDKRGIETRRVPVGDKLRGIRPEFFAADCRIDRGAHVEQSGQNTRAIRFDDWDRLIESKGCDCVCYIAANAGQFANRSEYHQAGSRGADPAQSWQRHEGFAPGCNSRVPARRGGRRFAKRTKLTRNQETGEAIYYNKGLQ